MHSLEPLLEYLQSFAPCFTVTGMLRREYLPPIFDDLQNMDLLVENSRPSVEVSMAVPSPRKLMTLYEQWLRNRYLQKITVNWQTNGYLNIPDVVVTIHHSTKEVIVSGEPTNDMVDGMRHYLLNTNYTLELLGNDDN